MQKRRAFTAEPIKGLMFQRLLGRLATNVFAEEVDPEGEATPNAPQLNFEQMIAQARKEEKDKLYPRIKKLEEENKVMTTSTNKYLLENAALKDEVEKLKASSGDDKKVKELEIKVETLEIENKSLKENAPNEEEIRKKVEAEYEVKLYAQEQVAANKDSIISILVPEITGLTKEEIDKAIASAKEKTISIKKDLGLNVDEEDETDEEDKSKKKPAKEKPKKVPAAVPATEPEEDFDAEYVRNLDPRSPEYKEFRKKMGLK